MCLPRMSCTFDAVTSVILVLLTQDADRQRGTEKM
jgi:hypothetical protein